ncbi:putative porin [Herbaspirillum sp. Sphag1AN]|uniref:porin n=1 Tax=unclassified Herbaspirillum TaxID=2624150 RepID=UPI001609DD67|nr:MULTISPECIES: porin [unclassified Herbaspirillum]MBB3212751.1 putative porin [Herbaspirillum sp. Sphag1AN]MBB3245948.1 putative porin [Herbaspirillum sp. Sphag64]
MKHKIVLPTLCLLAGAAHADSSLTLYGITDLGIRYSNGINASNAAIPAQSVLSIGSGIDYTSRWGVKGLEDLGSGLAVLFQLEGGFLADTGATAKSDKLFDRLSYVGMQSGLGTLTIGRQATILADALSTVDPLGMRDASFNPNITMTALSNTAFGTHSLGTQYGTSGYNDSYYRLDNMLKYSTTNGPLTTRLTYSAGEVAGSTEALSTIGGGLSYENGPLAISGAFMNFRNNANLGLDAYTIGAAYNMGSFTLKANYGYNVANTGNNTQTKARITSAGVTYAINSALLLTTAYYQVTRNSTGYIQDGFDRAFEFLEYSLSKQTSVYLEADYTKWKGNAAGVTGKSTNDSRGVGVTLGMMYKF